jgi:hypothetical protein
MGRGAKPSPKPALDTLALALRADDACCRELSYAHGLVWLWCCTVFAGFKDGLHASSMRVYSKSQWAYQSTA